MIDARVAGVLIFENLAERTLALAQLARRANPASGYEPLLDQELRPILGDCLRHGIRIVSNFGAANPRGAAAYILRLAREIGVPAPRLAVVEGDDLSDQQGQSLLRPFLRPECSQRTLISANAYQGGFEIAAALKEGAQIVVTGRVADPSLVLGPAVAHFGWAADDWNRLAGATMAGHLLECGAQVTGGYFADPGSKDVPDLANVGYPIAEIAEDGTCVITKPPGTGGLVDVRTVKEQLLYELHDPAAYVTPDVVADVTAAQLSYIGHDRVHVTGVRGHPRTPTLKVLAYFEGGWLGEAEISYAGPNAEARARLAIDIVRKRMGSGIHLRFDLIGRCSILGDDAGLTLSTVAPSNAEDVRLRAAARHDDPNEIDRLLREVYSLWLCGPAGGGGVRTSKRQRLSNVSCLVPRERLPATFHFVS